MVGRHDNGKVAGFDSRDDFLPSNGIRYFLISFATCITTMTRKKNGSPRISFKTEEKSEKSNKNRLWPDLFFLRKSLSKERKKANRRSKIRIRAFRPALRRYSVTTGFGEKCSMAFFAQNYAIYRHKGLMETTEREKKEEIMISAIWFFLRSSWTLWENQNTQMSISRKLSLWEKNIRWYVLFRMTTSIDLMCFWMGFSLKIRLPLLLLILLLIMTLLLLNKWFQITFEILTWLIHSDAREIMSEGAQ